MYKFRLKIDKTLPILPSFKVAWFFSNHVKMTLDTKWQFKVKWRHFYMIMTNKKRLFSTSLRTLGSIICFLFFCCTAQQWWHNNEINEKCSIITSLLNSHCGLNPAKKKIRKIVTLKGFKVWKLKNFKTALILREIDSRDSDRF